MRKALFLIIFLAPISHHLLLDLGAEAAPASSPDNACFSFFLSFFFLQFRVFIFTSLSFPCFRTLDKTLVFAYQMDKEFPQEDASNGNVFEFENGYVVETIVEGNKLGVEPHSIRVSRDGELLPVDSINSNGVRVTPPFSQSYCAVADESVGRQVPMAFLERIKDDFVLRFESGKATTAAANSLIKEFGPKLKEHMQYSVDHLEEISKLAKVKAQVSEVKGVMMENIEKSIQNLKETILSIIGLHES